MILHHKLVGEGRPVVILHGLFGALDNWMSFARHLSTHSFRCILVDLRNHGHSFHSTHFDYNVMADDIANLLQHLKITRANFIGHSMGGKVVMNLCKSKPSVINKMVVVDIAPRYYAPHHQHILDAIHLLDFDFVKTRKDAEQILKNEISDNATLQFILKNIYWKTDTQLAWRFNVAAIEKNIAAIGSQIMQSPQSIVPALFVRGEKSNYITPADELQIHSYFMYAEIATAPQAGHWVHADAPEWLLNKTLEFFKE